LIPNSHGREPGGQQSGGSAVFGRGLPAADHLIDRVSAQLRGNARRRLAIAASRIRDSAPPRRRRSGSSDAQALDRLARDAGNQVEVLVQMQHGEPGQRGRGGDDQVRYRRGADWPRSARTAWTSTARSSISWVRYSTASLTAAAAAARPATPARTGRKTRSPAW
jgi:hypothetical protein